ncbi:MAG: SWIM zinc finger family protein [Polyangia bacterium]
MQNAVPVERSLFRSRRPARNRDDRLQGWAAFGACRARFAVPSQSARTGSAYVVDLADEACTCPDYEQRRMRCKHQEAVLSGLYGRAP